MKNSRHSWPQRVAVTATLLALTACVTSHKDFKISEVKPNEAVAIGRMKVLYNGQEKPDCQVCFGSSPSSCQNLGHDGLVFKNLPRGKVLLRRIVCKDVSLQHYKPENWGFELAEDVTYFGEVTLHWQNKGGFKTTDLFGALGAAISESKNDGVLKVVVSDANQTDVTDAFKKQTQTNPVVVKKNLLKETL